MVVKSRDGQASPPSKLNNALAASKRAAFGRAKGWALQQNTPVSYMNANVPKLDLPLRGSKRKAGDAKKDEQRGHEAKRRIGHDGRPTASASGDT